MSYLFKTIRYIIFRDHSHLTYEGARTLLKNFNQFLIDEKLIN